MRFRQHVIIDTLLSWKTSLSRSYSTCYHVLLASISFILCYGTDSTFTWFVFKSFGSLIQKCNEVENFSCGYRTFKALAKKSHGFAKFATSEPDWRLKDFQSTPLPGNSESVYVVLYMFFCQWKEFNLHMLVKRSLYKSYVEQQCLSLWRSTDNYIYVFIESELSLEARFDASCPGRKKLLKVFEKFLLHRFASCFQG